MNSLIAQQVRFGGGSGTAPIVIQGPLKNINSLGDLINKLVTGLIYPLAAVILFFILVWGGYDFMFSQGNPEKLKTARAKITAGIVGFVLLVVSYLIVRVIAFIFGIGEGIF